MSKHILKLAILAIFLGLLVFFRPWEMAPKSSLFYPRLKVDEVVAIEVEHFIEGLRFERGSDGQWTVAPKKTALKEQVEGQEKATKGEEEKLLEEKTEKFPADAEKVLQIIQTVSTLEKHEPVSSNPEKQNTFQIFPAGLKVSFFNKDGKQIARLFVGKQGPDYFSTYVKDENSSEVYLVSEPLPSLLNRTIEEWKKKEGEKEEKKN